VKIRDITLLLPLLCLSAQIKANDTASSWKVWKKSSELSVSYRPAISINKKLSTKLIEIKATAKVNSTLSGFLYFIQQVSNTPNWLVNASTSQIIRQVSLNKNIFFIRFVGLWPLRPRLLVLQSTYWQNDDLSVEIALSDESNISNTNLNSLLGENSQNLLRVKIHQAHWKITALKVQNSGNKQDFQPPQLHIEYTFIADGIGDSPKWLAEHLALKSIWKSMRNIKRQLPKAKWQAHTIEGITEIN